MSKAASKKPRNPSMLQHLTRQVQKHADTEGTSINASEVSRVIRLTFDELAKIGGIKATLLLLREITKREADE